jgi:hypothetical protein
MKLSLYISGGPHDAMVLVFEGQCDPQDQDQLLTDKCQIEFDGDWYRITRFNKAEMRGVGVWESEKVVTE